MKRLRWLITVPLALVLIVLAVNNRHIVEVNLWPLDFIVSWPLFIFVYIGVVGGFLAGAVVAWVSVRQQHRRTRQRQTKKEANAAEAARRKNDLQISADAAKTPPALVD